ncbi:unnamed protein product [Anisakis simplex]|uniref:Bifunctional polynucleotide phosphatase/kinase (inferred by orthology to a human protein) n=1 Tax=Anisakis simplex TaxID=6269 RepID=A0A0M3IYC3_ANISI|nr:unnamed protein product [Anisakis simplex]
MDAWITRKKVKGDDEKEEVSGKWTKVGNDLFIFNCDRMEHRSKIAGFDLDGTIITTKSGKVFPVDEFDWQLLCSEIRGKLKGLHEDGYKIVFFTNQKGIQLGRLDANSFKRKVEAILAKLSIPIQVFVSIGTLKYRKPYTGMWDYMEKNGNGDVNIDLKECFYVGDAAGRLANAVVDLFENSILILITDAIMPNPRQEVLVLVGYPGCGKSKFAKKLQQEYDYGIVNRDTMKTWQKCVQNAKIYVQKGKSVVVDNTNGDIESRKRYINLAKSQNVDCRCFVFTCGLEQASHHCKYRIIIGTDALHEEVSTMVLRMFKSKYQEPTTDEGFSSVVKVNFVPDVIILLLE